MDKITNVKKVVWYIVSMSVCLVLSAGGGVYDDVAAWWHFDYDADADGKADVGEILDQRNWDGSAHHASSVTGPSGSPLWTSDAISPAGSVLYGGKSMLFNPAVTSTTCYPATYYVNSFSVPGSATLVTRLRWDGHAFSSSIGYSQLYFNGFGSGTGWIFSLYNGVPHLYSTIGNASGLGTALTVGKWYELALVITDNGDSDTVTCYLWPDGGSLSKVTKTGKIVPSTAGSTTKIGCEYQYTASTTDNAKRAFKGAVNHLAVWNRALSEREVFEAMRAPAPEVFRIGLNNGILNDLRTEYSTDSDYWPDDPWHTMRRALTSSYRTMTLHIPMVNNQAQYNQVVHVDTTTGGALKLIVNGVTNASETAVDNQIAWLVPAEQFVTGTNAVELVYEGSSWIGIDCVEIGGSWQLGTKNNVYTEFGDESNVDNFYVANPDLTDLERAVSSGDRSVNLIFSLSETLSGNYSFTYSTRLISQGGGSGTHPLQVLVNGTLLASLPAQSNGTDVSLRIDKELTVSGENVITLRYNDTETGWICFDYHSLNVRQSPGSTLILIY